MQTQEELYAEQRLKESPFHHLPPSQEIPQETKKQEEVPCQS